MSQTTIVDAKVERKQEEIDQEQVKCGVVGGPVTSPARAAASLETAKETRSNPSLTGSEKSGGENERGVLDGAVLVEGHCVERTVIGQDTGTRTAVQGGGGSVQTTEVTVDEALLVQVRERLEEMPEGQRKNEMIEALGRVPAEKIQAFIAKQQMLEEEKKLFKGPDQDDGHDGDGPSSSG